MITIWLIENYNLDLAQTIAIPVFGASCFWLGYSLGKKKGGK